MDQEPDELEVPLPPTLVRLEPHQWLKCGSLQIASNDSGHSVVTFSPNQLCYASRFSDIIVYDLFFGTIRRLLPLNLKWNIFSTNFRYLNNNHGLMFCRTKTDVFVSLVSLNLTDNTYKFIGNSFRIPNLNGKYQAPLIDDISLVSNQLVSVKVKNLVRTNVYLYELNERFTKLEFSSSVKVARNARWFNQIGGKVFYARCKLQFICVRIRDDEYKLYFFVHGIATLSLDGTVEKLENTGTRFEFLSNGGWSTTRDNTFQHCWHAGHLVCLVKFCSVNLTRPTSHSCAVFEVATRKWTQVQLNQTNIDADYIFFNLNDGILTCLKRKDTWNNDKKSLQIELMLSRYPLRRPESLYNLVWFKAQEYSVIKSMENFAI